MTVETETDESGGHIRVLLKKVRELEKEVEILNEKIWELGQDIYKILEGG